MPDEAKSSYQVEGTGYDTYLRDAHRQVWHCCLILKSRKLFFFVFFPRNVLNMTTVNYYFQFKDFCGVCLHWDWRGNPKPFEKCNLDLPFFEGHFLKVLFDRMGRILDQVSMKRHEQNLHIYIPPIFCCCLTHKTCMHECFLGVFLVPSCFTVDL